MQTYVCITAINGLSRVIRCGQKRGRMMIQMSWFQLKRTEFALISVTSEDQRQWEKTPTTYTRRSEAQKLSTAFLVSSDDFCCVKIRIGSKGKRLSKTSLFTHATKNTIKKSITKVKIFCSLTLLLPNHCHVERALHQQKMSFSPTKISVTS